MLKDIVDYVQKAARLPEISGERCVHALTEQASCQACVDACPRQAWVLDEDSLGLAEDQCDGCGLCVPACPQQAIQHNSIKPVLRPWDNHPAALYACDKTDLDPVEGVIPCVHALGLVQLLTLYRQGCRQLMLCHADCDDCPRGDTTRLETRLSALNQALRQRNQVTFDYYFVSSEQWQSLYAQPAMQAGGQLSRRQFFRRSSAQLAEAGLHQSDASGTAISAPGQLLPAPESEGESIWPHVPVMDARACNGCDACIKLCPQQALRLTEACYQIETALCNGCGVCVDVCDQAALSLHHWQTAAAVTEIPVQQANCRACGAPFHYPAMQESADLCRICHTTSHYKALHQVYS